LFYTICLSFLISVYFEKTKRSIVTPLVMHTMANLSIGLIPLVFNQTGALIQLSLMFLFVVVIYIKNRSWINKKPL
jgi:membrane protease YdiL (CAAX protease family)